LLLTSTVTLPASSELGSAHRSIVDDVAVAGTRPAGPNLTAHTLSTRKLDPRTVTSVSSETTPLDGAMLATVGSES